MRNSPSSARLRHGSPQWLGIRAVWSRRPRQSGTDPTTRNAGGPMPNWRSRLRRLRRHIYLTSNSVVPPRRNRPVGSGRSRPCPKSSSSWSHNCQDSSRCMSRSKPSSAGSLRGSDNQNSTTWSHWLAKADTSSRVQPRIALAGSCRRSTCCYSGNRRSNRPERGKKWPFQPRTGSIRRGLRHAPAPPGEESGVGHCDVLQVSI